jgi:hypothetical protein
VRRYEIKITNPQGQPLVIKQTSGNGDTLFNGTFSSTDSNGNTIPGALNVEMEIQNTVMNAATGGSFIRIHGIGLPLLKQASNFNPSFNNTAVNGAISSGILSNKITISAGMAKGLPLANASQYQVVSDGQIMQAFGNWQGTSQTLEFMLLPTYGTNEQPFKFTFQCKQGQSLAAAIQSNLSNAMPSGTKVEVNINQSLVPNQDVTHNVYNLPQFVTFLNQLSAGILKQNNYYGIQAFYQNGTVSVYDFNTLQANPKQLQFTDFIGQPTWIAPLTMTFKTVMRGDLKIGDIVQMPTAFQQKGLILTLPQSQSQFRNTIDFQGKFWIQTIRHYGNFRQPNADSWVTIYQVVQVQ